MNEETYKHKYYAMIERYKDLLEQHDDLMDREHKLYADFLKIKMSISADDIPEALAKISEVKYRYREGFIKPKTTDYKPKEITNNTMQRTYRYE